MLHPSGPQGSDLSWETAFENVPGALSILAPRVRVRILPTRTRVVVGLPSTDRSVPGAGYMSRFRKIGLLGARILQTTQGGGERPFLTLGSGASAPAGPGEDSPDFQGSGSLSRVDRVPALSREWGRACWTDWSGSPIWSGSMCPSSDSSNSDQGFGWTTQSRSFSPGGFPDPTDSSWMTQFANLWVLWLLERWPSKWLTSVPCPVTSNPLLHRPPN